jgi:hypothetical protein
LIVSKTCTQEARRGRKKTDGAIVDRFFIVEKPVIQKLSSTQNKPEFLVKELANATQRHRETLRLTIVETGILGNLLWNASLLPPT